MWASIEAARKAGSGAHIAIRIDNLRYDEGSDGKLRVNHLVGSLATVVMVAQRSEISVGLTPDQQGKRVRYEATAVVEMTGAVPPRLHAILDGKPEGIIQFHELSGVGSIGDDRANSAAVPKGPAFSFLNYYHFQSARFCLFLWLKVRPIDVKVT